MDKYPVFSIITVCYRRLAFLQEALGAMFRQTYPNIEIIIVDNGAIPEVHKYITELERSDSRVKIVHFKENQYKDDDPAMVVRVCFNAGLKAATGDYVFYQSDDDLISDDYLDKMAKLFQGNLNCTSAAAIINCIDEEGRLIDKGPRISNYRPQYMPGHLLALSTLSQDKYGAGIMFSAPGTVFSFKRDDLIKAGGYHMAIEPSHMYGIVPFGVTGFDDTAVLYWRRHQNQTNKHLTGMGHTGILEINSLIKDWQIEKRWQIYGKDTAHYVVRRILENIYDGANFWFVVNLYHFRLKACLRILKDAGNSFYFWRKLPVILWTERRQLWYYLKPKIRSKFEKYSWLIHLPVLAHVYKRVLR